MKKKWSNILVIRFSSIGDIIHTTSVLGTLNNHFPDVKIDYMTLEKFSTLLDGHPHINKLISLNSKLKLSDLKKVKTNFKLPEYNLIVDLHNSPRSRLVRNSIISKNLISVSKPRLKRLGLFSFHYNSFNSNFNIKSWLHEPLLEFLPINTILSSNYLSVSTGEKNIVNKKFIKKDSFINGYYVIAPGSAWSQKKWNLDRYLKVIDMCYTYYNICPILIGSENDRICKDIKNNSKVDLLDLHGKTNLRESLAIVSSSKFILGSDTGFVYAGEALKIPSVVILGPTSRETGAGLFSSNSVVVENNDIWCRPCSQNGSSPCYRDNQYCMDGISAERVMKAIESIQA